MNADVEYQQAVWGAWMGLLTQAGYSQKQLEEVRFWLDTALLGHLVQH